MPRFLPRLKITVWLRAFALALAFCALHASAVDVTITRADSDEEFVGPLPSWRNFKTHYGAAGDGVGDDTAALQAAFGDLRLARNNGYSVLYLPAGTYRITGKITGRKQIGEDYQGTMLVGEDPATTILRYDGAAGGNILEFDGWYTKLSRLAFDGNNKRANIGLRREGTFSTYCEVSDCFFKDFNTGILFGSTEEDGGHAETLVIRCQFDRCGDGIATGNWNALDIWCWSNIFRDCTTGITQYTGNFHAVGNLFLRSTQWDVGAYNAFAYLINDNVSVGSKMFSNIPFGYSLLLRNRVYAPASAGVIKTGSLTLLLDNVIDSSAYPGQSPVEVPTYTLAVGNTYTAAHGTAPSDPLASRGLSVDPARAFDNDNVTSVERTDYSGSNGVYIDYHYTPRAARTVASYSVRSETNSAARAPASFRLQGSNNDGRTWITLDTRAGVTWTAAAQRQVFTLAAPISYQAYRFFFETNAESSQIFRVTELELLSPDGLDTTGPGQGFALSPDPNVRLRTIDEYPSATVAAPTTLAMPLTPPNLNRAIFTVARNIGDDAQAIQSAINAAAASSARAVVHLPYGAYFLARTVVVPAGKDIQIIGDGAGSNSAAVFWNGPDGGTVLRLDGPNHATLRDFSLRGGNPILITNANQVGGRVYAEQVTSFSGSRMVAGSKSYYLNGVEDADIDFVASQSGGNYGAIVDVGGPKLAAGQSAAGRHSLVTGTYEGLQTHAEVLRGARLTTLSLYSEGARRHMVDLTGEGFLNIDHSVADPRIPTFTVDGFKGRFTYLLNAQGAISSAAPNAWFDLRGDGTAMNTLVGLNDFTVSSASAIFRDTTFPASANSFTLNYPSTDITQKQTGLDPSDDFLRDQLALLRTVKVAPPVTLPAGLTDVKIFRVTATPSRGGTGLEVRAAPDPAAVIPATAPVLTGTATAPNLVELSWTAVPGVKLYSLERRASGEVGFSEVKLFQADRTTYRDVNLSPYVRYTYRIRAINDGGASPYSAEVAALTRRVTAAGPRANAGGPAVGAFVIDSGVTGVLDGDGAITTAAAIDRSGVTDPAPELVYQSGTWTRSPEFSYTFGGFSPRADVRLRLHFAEIEPGLMTVGARIFNVFVNDAPALTNFDIMAAAGASNRAVLREVEASADDEGYVIVRFVGVNYSALIVGLEIARTAAPNPPAALQTHATTQLVRLDWIDNATDETGFRIERRTGAVGAWVSVDTVPTNRREFVDRTVSSGQTYYYRLRSIGTTVESSPCAEVRIGTTMAPGTSTARRLLDGLTPASPNNSDADDDYELGMEIISTVPGTITHLRHWKFPGETGPHTGRVWKSDGTLLASVLFSGESASGWQQQELPAPLPIYANESYVVSVNINTHYPSTDGGLATSRVNGPLSSVAGGRNGRYAYVAGEFPADPYNENYFRDLVFSDAPPAAPTNLIACRDNATQATLTWTDNATFEDGYLIERSTDGGATWQGADLAPANARTITLTGFTSGQAGLLRLTGTSLAGPSASVTANLTALSSLQTWRQTKFGTIENTGTAADLSDDDHDGLVNLLEYALATDPRSASVSAVPIASRDAQGRLTLTFLRARADLTYLVQGSDDLLTWQDVASYGPADTSTVSLIIPIVCPDPGGSISRRFLRLKILPP